MNLRFSDALLEEPTSVSEAEEIALTKRQIEDAALVHLVWPGSDPKSEKLRHQAAGRVAQAVMRVATTEQIAELKLPDTATSPLDKLAVVVDDVITGSREEAIIAAVKQNLNVHVVNDNTGEIESIPVVEYIPDEELAVVFPTEVDTPLQSNDSELSFRSKLRTRVGKIIGQLATFASKKEPQTAD